MECEHYLDNAYTAVITIREAFEAEQTYMYAFADAREGMGRRRRPRLLRL
jgi:hypothetical protein